MQIDCDSDDRLIARFLGSRYLGRRYLRYSEIEALGLVDNRASLRVWMDAGAFPRAIRIPGAYGKTLVWLASEIAQHIAQRVAERNLPSPEIDEDGPSQSRPLDSDSDDPLQAGRNTEQAPCPYPTSKP